MLSAMLRRLFETLILPPASVLVLFLLGTALVRWRLADADERDRQAGLGRRPAVPARPGATPVQHAVLPL